RLPPIGHPIDNTSIHILDDELQPVEDGESGEIFIGGVPLARGYLGRADLTAERFIETTALPGERLYRTGDLGCRNPDGEFEYLGRIDGQVKIRGYRIEPGEIEVVLAGHPGISQVVVKVCEDGNTGKRLVAYTVFKNGSEPDATELRQYLGERIPDYMIPSIFMPVDTMPRTPSGKIDRKALPAPGNQRPHLAQACIRPYTDKQKILAECWNHVLDLDQIGIHDNFFELGGNSLLALKVIARIRQQMGDEISVVKLFQYPTISLLEKYLVSGVDAGAELNQLQFRAEQQSRHDSQPGIAIVGMAGRFPGAADVEQLWRNLCDGIESISYFTEETLDNSIDPAVRHNPAYVGARGIMDDADKFDAAFFGITPREAEIMDPQQRVFLEIAWHALENAGYDSERFPGLIGVYAGTGNNSYYHENVWRHPDKIASLGSFLTMVANEKDYVATRVAHKMNLTGPCISIHTGCSTSLVSVCEAFRSLASYQCDIAIAGGVSVTSPIRSGYLYQEGGIFSADGHTRSFDSEASGTVFSDGAAAIVLKRLDDALESGDHIHAVIRGVALNNDGAKKVSFTAPSVDGQAAVIAMAQANAGVDPDSIGYIEAHGTATPLGDPIEMEALTQAFRYRTDRKQFCAIGSIKSNLGHLTSAAGIAGLIKATLSVERGILPPTLNVKKPNPKIDFDNSPFFVNTSLGQWEGGSAAPRRAGISSFGVGGTNAHIVIEQAPELPDSGLSRPAQLLLLSAKNTQALDVATDELQAHLLANPETNLADTAFTLQTGRQHFNQRRLVVCSSVPQAVEQLQSNNPNIELSREQERV
ncbi:MAG: AMP-binding protein, partial [Deltaproteobacteria bacterium]|nr:AMP-binding protein [Deltaproteobacteria bacterium]